MKVPFPVRAVPSLTFTAWLTPPPLPASVAQRDVETLAPLTPCYFGGVPGSEIGEGPMVIAVHGWGGRPAQMVPLAKRLASQGYRVLVPRLPGHAGGPPTDIKKAASAIRAIIDDVGEPEIVVGHSLASMVLRLAFAESSPPRVVLIAPALDVRDALRVFSTRLRLLPWARRGLTARLRKWDPALWPVLSDLHAEQMPGAEILILHDPLDGDTSFTRSAELAAVRPGTSIVAVEGAGHVRILADETVLDHIAGFVAEGEAVGSSAA